MKKEIIPPIVITIIMVLYYILYFGILLSLFDGIIALLFFIAPIAFSIVMVIVCIERIKEIKEDNDDDISKY